MFAPRPAPGWAVRYRVSSRVSKDGFRSSPGDCQSESSVHRELPAESLASSRSNDDRSRSLPPFYSYFLLDPSLVTFVCFPFRTCDSSFRTAVPNLKKALSLAFPSRVALPARPSPGSLSRISNAPFVLVSFVFSPLVFSCHDSRVSTKRSLWHKVQPISRQVIPDTSHLLYSTYHHLSTPSLTYFPCGRCGWRHTAETSRVCLRASFSLPYQPFTSIESESLPPVMSASLNNSISSSTTSLRSRLFFFETSSSMRK